eukprot:scaffold209074_cov39-Prasinocladus_malaysianus.AAC.1
MTDTSLLASFLSSAGISNSDDFDKQSASDAHIFSFIARLKAAVAKATGVRHSSSAYDKAKSDVCVVQHGYRGNLCHIVCRQSSSSLTGAVVFRCQTCFHTTSGQ